MRRGRRQRVTSVLVLAVGSLSFLSKMAEAQRQLTSNQTGSRYNARWSPDGREIVCLDGDRGNNLPMVIMDVDTLQERVILPTGWRPFEWSPDGTKIVFIDPSMRSHPFWTSPLTGGQFPVLMPQAPATGRSAPRWTGDSSAILYHRSGISVLQMCRANLSDGLEVLLTDPNTDSRDGQANPAGDILGFWFWSSGQAIGKARLSGGGPITTLVPPDGRRRYFPLDWSPDGTVLAYGADAPPGGSAGIFTISREGGNETFIGPAGEPQWSPDGEWLGVFGPSAVVSVLDVRTGQVTPVGGVPVFSDLPALHVSPDGTEILYLSTDARNIDQIWTAPSGRSPVPAIVGTRRVGSDLGVALRAPGDPGRAYVMAAAFSKEPALQVQGRSIPLAPDPLFVASLTRPDLFIGFTGILDTFARGSATVRIPASGGVAGLRFYLAFVTVDGAGTLRTVSGARPVTVLP